MHKIKFNSNVQLLLFYIILTLDVGDCKLQSSVYSSADLLAFRDIMQFLDIVNLAR